MFEKNNWTLVAVLAWMMVKPDLTGGAVVDPPANFLVAITNMMSLPNLAYEEISQDRRLNLQGSTVEWKHANGKTYCRMHSNGPDFLSKETVYLYDGAVYYTLFGDVALEDDQQKPGFPGMPGVKYLAAAQNALPVPDEFQGVPCWRYEWPCEHMVARFAGSELNLDLQSVIRNDFIDQATGWWVGYTMTNTEGPFEGLLRLDQIRTNELSADLFATPKAPIRIRPHTSAAYTEEMAKRMVAMGIIEPSALKRAEGDGLLGMLSQRYHLPLSRIFFCVSGGAAAGILVWLFLELRRKKHS